MSNAESLYEHDSQSSHAPAGAWGGQWDPLGVTPDGRGGVNVALWAEGAEAVDFCIVSGEGSDLVEHRVRLHESTFHVWHGYVPDVPPGTRYGFRVHGPWSPEAGQRFNPHKMLIDPYARAIDGALALNSSVYGHVGSNDLHRNDEDSLGSVPLGVVVDSEFDWEGVQPPRTSWGDTTIYEVHVKGFTRQHPGIPAELRGTYAGLAHPAAIEHLVGLGVSAVELLPIHHFIDETHLLENGLSNYWGYNSIGFFAPHGPYAAGSTRGDQVNEFKSMVKALHAAGIEVILDVVYNHTAEGNQHGPTLSFRGIDNSSYYRLQSNDQRYYADYTGCGNTLNATKPHVLQLITDSLRYWVTEMHVDGFRFDLASALARSFHDVDMLGSFMTTIQQDPVLRRTKLIAEPWDLGSGGYQVGEFPPLWTEWNDKFRDCMRDFWRGAAGVGELGWRMSGSADVYTSEGRRPYASINFVTAHDGYTLRDLVTYEEKHNEANGENNRDGNDYNRSWNTGVEGETTDAAINDLRQRRLRSMLTSLLLATGVPMLTAGDEFGRTQHGNNNAYCQDGPISWFDWDLADWQRDLLAFTSGLFELRRRHRAFRQRYFFAGKPLHQGGPEDLAWFDTDGTVMGVDTWNSPLTRAVGMYLSGELKSRTADGRPMVDDSFLMLMNGDDSAAEFVLPSSPYANAYEHVLDTSRPQSEQHPLKSDAGDRVRVEAFGCVLLRVTDR